MLVNARGAHGLPHREPHPHAIPPWAWGAMILFVALLLYASRWFA
jgi:hypothetical protein